MSESPERRDSVGDDDVEYDYETERIYRILSKLKKYVIVYPELSGIEKRYDIGTIDGCNDALSYCESYATEKEGQERNRYKKMLCKILGLSPDSRRIVMSGELDEIFNYCSSNSNVSIDDVLNTFSLSSDARRVLETELRVIFISMK